MKKNMKNIIGGIGILLIFVALIFGFFYFGGGSASVITGSEDKVMFGDLTCTVPEECRTQMINQGFPESELDEQLVGYQFICENNICGVESK